MLDKFSRPFSPAGRDRYDEIFRKPQFTIGQTVYFKDNGGKATVTGITPFGIQWEQATLFGTLEGRSPADLLTDTLPERFTQPDAQPAQSAASAPDPTT